MNETINVQGTDLSIVEIDGQRVVTLAMVDRAHQRPEGTARRNFNEHREARFNEGEDYFVRNSYEAAQLGFTAPNGITLLTESGYLMLVKSLTDDLAWKVQRELVNSYFRPKTPRPVTPLSAEEMLLAQCQVMVDHKRRIDENEQAIARVEQRVEKLAETHVFTSCPSNAEPITHIRKRIGEEYGLSANVISHIMFQSPYVPRPAGEVKNQHENANGSTYTVFRTQDVNAVFKRVFAESTQVTDAQYTHPYIDGRFKMRGRKPSKVVKSDTDLFEPESSP